MFELILGLLAGAAGMGAAVRFVRPVRDAVVGTQGSGGPGPNPPPPER